MISAQLAVYFESFRLTSVTVFSYNVAKLQKLINIVMR